MTELNRTVHIRLQDDKLIKRRVHQHKFGDYVYYKGKRKYLFRTDPLGQYGLMAISHPEFKEITTMEFT